MVSWSVLWSGTNKWLFDALIPVSSSVEERRWLTYVNTTLFTSLITVIGYSVIKVIPRYRAVWISSEHSVCEPSCQRTAVFIGINGCTCLSIVLYPETFTNSTGRSGSLKTDLVVVAAGQRDERGKDHSSLWPRRARATSWPHFQFTPNVNKAFFF